MAGWQRIVACLVVLVGWIPAVSASPDDPKTVAELVAAVEGVYASATSVRADFTQIVRNAAMGTEDRQRGRIALERPRKVRVELGTPVTSSVVSDGKTLWIYSALNKSVVETPELGVGGNMGALLDDLSHLDELFVVTILEEKPQKPGHTVRLVPRQAGPYKAIEVRVSKQKYVLQELVLVDQLDNQMEMNFTNVRMNQDVPDAEFTFVVPAGVQVVRTQGM